MRNKITKSVPRYLVGIALFLCMLDIFGGQLISAKIISPSLTVTPEPTPTLTPTPEPTTILRTDITKETSETLEPLRKLLDEQAVSSVFPFNFIKMAIRGSVASGIAPNTIVLLLLLPGVTLLISAMRQLIGVGGFGIFLPASLAVVFVATGPIIGILLFLAIVFVSTFVRISMRRTKMKLQYLPRMSLVLLIVVLGILSILFMAPYISWPDMTGVSIFPILILVLLAEDFSKVQLGKSAKVAINLASETLLLAILSYFFLTTRFVQEFALLNPEIWVLVVALLNYTLGKYVGLRVLEIWRFRNLIKN